MSRSTILLKEIFTGIHLVAITEIKNRDGVFIRFSANGNKHFDKIYDYTSKEFLKMCGSAGTITDESVISTNDIGKRLWICIKEVWHYPDTVNFYIFDTFPYLEGTTTPPVIDGNPADNKDVPHGVFREVNNESITIESKPIVDKKKVIAEAREMIKKVESKPKDDFDIM